MGLGCRHRLGIRRTEAAAKPGTPGARVAAISVAVAVQHGAVAVIHGRGVDAVLVVAIAATMSMLLRSTLIGWTTPTAASAAPSRPGGTIRSYVHNSLFWQSCVSVGKEDCSLLYVA